MQLRNLLFAFFALLSGGALYADDWKPDPQFRSLFNGKDLTGWCFRAKPTAKSVGVGKVGEKFDGKTISSDEGRYSARTGHAGSNAAAPHESERAAGHALCKRDIACREPLRITD
jgi:hypothetical protein